MCSYDAMGHLYGAASDAIHAIEYAMSKGAAIINNSWRLLPSVTADGIQHPTVDEINNLTVAIQMTNCQPMYPNCKPALFVAAAGNALPGESENNDLVNGKVYPASINVSNVIVVAATNQTDALWVDSHYGPTTVHIAAPGVNIDSTSLGNQNNGISATSGTSMAAPHVAGCAALLQARSSAISSSLLSVTDLKNKILNNADPIVGLMVIGGRRLNCAQAMSSVPSYGDTTPPASPTGLTLR